MAMTFDDGFPLMAEIEAGLDPRYYTPMMVAFGYEPMKDAKKSAEAGYDVFVDVEFVKIATPGDKYSLYFQPATDQHRKRFPKAYAAFKDRGVKPTEGMPLEQWPPISKSMVMSLKALHVHTVEALASVHEGNIDKLGYSARELRDKARAYLANAQDSAATMRVEAEKKALQDELAVMREQIAALSAAKADPDVEAARKPRKS